MLLNKLKNARKTTSLSWSLIFLYLCLLGPPAGLRHLWAGPRLRAPAGHRHRAPPGHRHLCLPHWAGPTGPAAGYFVYCMCSHTCLHLVHECNTILHNQTGSDKITRNQIKYYYMLQNLVRSLWIAARWPTKMWQMSTAWYAERV